MATPRVRPAGPLLAALLAVTPLLFAVGGCGDSASPQAGPAQALGKTAVITQILLMYQRPSGPTKNAKRSKAETHALAVSILDRIHHGERMEDLLVRYTDDLNPQGKPFNDGSYAITPASAVKAAVQRAAFETPVGELAPDPVDTGIAYLVIRRDS